MAEFLVDSSESTTELKTNGKVENGLSDSNETVESVQFFEGVEKLLEIWFTSTDGNNSKRDLRQIPRQKWESLLKIVRCEIISFCRNDVVDAYVLSESSMFVSKRRLILKTCGTTTPLQCLEPLLDLVESYTGFDKVEDLFYSRKNYKRPELQMSPHHAFEEEVTLLDTFFPGYEASLTWKKLRRKFARVQLKILRKMKITEKDNIIHQHLIYLKGYISTKNINQFDPNSDTLECSEECYQHDVSSDEDQLEKYELESKIKTEPQNQDNDEAVDPQNEISVKEEPGQDYADIPTITLSDSDEEVNAQENHNLQRSADTVQDVKPKIEKTAEISSRKGKQIINRKPIIKGMKAKTMNQDGKFDCNFPKTKTEKKKGSSTVEVALQSFQSSVLNMKRKKTISQYAAVMNNHLQMLPEEERLNGLMEVLEIIESFM